MRIRVALGFVLLMILAVTLWPKSTQTQTNPVVGGRYQIIISPGLREDTFLLDTQTGKTWVQTRVTDVKDQPLIWIYRDKVDDAADFLQWFKRQ